MFEKKEESLYPNSSDTQENQSSADTVGEIEQQNSTAEEQPSYTTDVTEEINEESSDFSADTIEQKPKKKKNKTFITIIISVLIVCALVFSSIALMFSGFLDRNITALKVGDRKYNIAEYSYYYHVTANAFIQNYSDYGIEMPDTTQSLKNQTCSINESLTWDEYFKQQTNTYLQMLTALCDEANRLGITLDEEDQTTIDTQIQSLKDYCSENDKVFEDFIQEEYGTGVSESLLREALADALLAQKYSDQQSVALQPTDEEIENYFNEHKSTYLKATIRYTFIEPEYEENAPEEEKAAAIANTVTLANEFISKITDEDSFEELAYEYASDEYKTIMESYDNFTLLSNITQDSIGIADIVTWVFSDSRNYGDAVAIPTDDGCFVLYFISMGRDEQISVDTRHILATPETTDDEASLAAAKEKIEELLAEFEKTDKTEDAFIQLSDEVNAKGDANLVAQEVFGIYSTDVVEGYRDWAFDENRKVGDYGIVESSYGYHLVYFCGTGDAAWKVEVVSDMQAENFDNTVNALLENYPMYQSSIGMSKVGA